MTVESLLKEDTSLLGRIVELLSYKKRPKRSSSSPRRNCACESVDLLEDIRDRLDNLNIEPEDADDYKAYLVRKRRLKILRDLWYPSWQADWG